MKELVRGRRMWALCWLLLKAVDGRLMLLHVGLTLISHLLGETTSGNAELEQEAMEKQNQFKVTQTFPSYNTVFLFHCLTAGAKQKRKKNQFLVTFSVSAVTWLQRQGATWPADLHRYSRRAHPQAPCLLSSPPHHWQDGYDHQLWEDY